MASKDVDKRRVVLFSHPRTRSHLIERMLSAQPNTAYFQHPFAWSRPMQMAMLDSGPYNTSTEASREVLKKQWQDGYDSWVRFCKDTEAEGKIAFTHTHPHFCASPPVSSQYYYDGKRTDLVDDDPFWTLQASDGSDSPIRTTPLAVPDSFLLTLTPIFSIRNPLHMIPSAIRICLEVQDVMPITEPTTALNNTLIWTRTLFDWYQQQHRRGKTPKPVIVDSDDAVTKPTILESLCKAVGFQEGNLLSDWQPAGKEEYAQVPEFVTKIKKTIMGSKGVEKTDTAEGLTIASERPKWKEEFGEDMAAKVEKLVEAAMDDYKYLYERRLSM